MAARSTLLCLALAASLSAQESKPNKLDLLAPRPEPATLTAADRIDLLRSELATLKNELVYLQELKAKGGMLLRIKASLSDRILGYRVFGEGLTPADIARPTKATFMDPKDFREGSLDMVLLVNNAPIMRQEIDEMVFYLKSYPRPEKHRQIMTIAVTALVDLKAIESAFASNIPAARERIDAIGKKLAEGADFGDLAATMSQAESSARMGEMGMISRKGTNLMLTMHAFRLKAGEVSDVIQTLRGFEIIEVLEHILGDTPPMDKVRIRTIVASFVGGPEGQSEIDQVLDGVAVGRIDLRMRDRAYSRFLPKIFR